MKIKVVHDECGREALVEQILENGGHCPWDGKPYNRDYTAVLAGMLSTAQQSGSILESALQEIAGMGGGFHLGRESVMAPLEEPLASLESGKTGVRA